MLRSLENVFDLHAQIVCDQSTQLPVCETLQDNLYLFVKSNQNVLIW